MEFFSNPVKLVIGAAIVITGVLAYRRFGLGFTRTVSDQIHAIQLGTPTYIPPNTYNLQSFGSKYQPIDFFNVQKFLTNPTQAIHKYANCLLYTETTPSTNTILESINVNLGVLMVSARQTAGRGRTGDWTSPLGCLMFTYKFSCRSQMAPLINAVIPLAIVQAIRRVSKHPEKALTSIHVKWPNDILADGVKIAGILVNSLTMGNNTQMTIGMGINISNSQPTSCLNDILGEQISPELLLAAYLEEFDEYITEWNPNAVIETYLANWYHKGKFAKLKGSEERVKLATIGKSGEIIAQAEDGSHRVLLSSTEFEYI